MKSPIKRILGPARVAALRNDRWRWRVTLVGADGRRHSRDFDDQAQADAFARGARSVLEEQMKDALGHADGRDTEDHYNREDS